MADGPLFSMWPLATSGTAGGGSSQAETFAEHAANFSASVDEFRAVCDRVRGGGDSELLRTQGELLVLKLKRSAHDLHNSLRQGVHSTDQARNQVDGVAVRLHELAYEKGHLERDIAFERRFGSAHEQIELPSAEDMLAQGASCRSAGANEHQLMLELLAYELSLREQLVGEESSLARRKKELQAQVTRKRKLVGDVLPRQLSGLCAAAKSIASFAPQTGQTTNTVAIGLGDQTDRLPPPLFTLVSQFETYRDEFADASGADMTVRILGDATTIRNDKDGPAPPMFKQRRKNSPNRTSALEPFPLWAEVTHSDGKRGTLRLTFTYLPQLSLLAADGEWQSAKGRGKSTKKLSGPQLLAQLFEGDHGLELPNPGSVHVLGSGSWPVAEAEAAATSAAQAIGRPYRWVQWFGGLYFPRPSTSATPNAADQRPAGTGMDGEGTNDEQEDELCSVYSTIGRIFDLVGAE